MVDWRRLQRKGRRKQLVLGFVIADQHLQVYGFFGLTGRFVLCLVVGYGHWFV
jgi:hypothetical protein